MKHRLSCFLLALALTWTLFPAARAEKVTFSSLHVSDFAVPAAGERADAHYYVFDEAVSTSNLYWFCDTDGETMADDAVFEEGKEYSYHINASAISDDYEFDTALQVFVNGGTDRIDPDCTSRTEIGLCLWTLPGECKAALAGDVDLDCDVTANDVTLLARHVAGIESLTASLPKKNADYNNDGGITSDDLTLLARTVAKIA